MSDCNMPPPGNFFKMVQFGAHFDLISSLKFFKKYNFLYKKTNILDTHLLLGITHGNFLEKMLRLMLLGVYFERISKMKWLFLYRNNYSIVTLNEKWLFSYKIILSAAHMLGVMLLSEKI